MRQRLVVAVAVIACIPVFAIAQTSGDDLQTRINVLLQRIQALQNQITALQGETPANGAAPVTPASVITACPALSRSLTVGARGDDVVALQRFLAAQGVFTEEATGYFGPITEAAVQRLQAGHALVSSGSPATTGYGAVGPQTRALIARLCIGSTPAATSAETSRQCPAIASATAPSEACGGTWEKLVSAGCHVGWRCVLTASGTNRPPVITSIDGPTTLTVGEYASWKVNAIDPEQGALFYSVTWGDEGLEDILKAIAGLGGTYISSPVVSHSYAKAGTYSVNVSVRDSGGNISVASLSVVVSASTAPGGTSAFDFSAFTGLATSTSAASCVTPWGAQVVRHQDFASWQPFFTNGTYFASDASTTPRMRCDNSAWLRCDSNGLGCQAYTAPTSTAQSGGALRSYAGVIGTPCSPEGSTTQVSVPPGTQLCQWLQCTTATETQTVTLRCTNTFWSDYQSY